MELINEAYKAGERGADSTGLKQALKTAVVLLAPFVPHIAEEIWQRLGEKASIFQSGWPVYDIEAIQKQKVLIVVQINGKLRAKIEAALNSEEKDLRQLILHNQALTRWIENRQIKRFVVVPNKLVNIVV